MTSEINPLSDPNLARCPSPNRPFVIGSNSTTKKAVVILPRCGKWSCPYCARENAGQWFHAGMRGVNVFVDAGQPAHFMTLTMPGHVTQKEAFRRLRVGWPKLRKRIERISPVPMSYFTVCELQKRGIVHTHSIVLCEGITLRWLKSAAYGCGFGYIAHIDAVRHAAGAAAYLTKYLSKQLEVTRWPEGFRRVRTSTDWPGEPDKPDKPDWEYLAFHEEGQMLWHYWLLRDLGFSVHITNEVQARSITLWNETLTGDNNEKD